MGQLLGAIMLNSQTAGSTSTVLVLFFMLASGFYTRELPSWIEWVRYLSYPWCVLSMHLL